MARHPWLDPGPFHLEGGAQGVVLIHGFTGSPAEMRPLGEALAASGFTVLAPLLPGHGTTVEDLARVAWTDWTEAVAEAQALLTGRCERVYVAGLSLGSLLTMNLAAERPVEGIAIYSPPILIDNPFFRLSRLYGWISAAIPQSWTGTTPADPEIDRRTWYYESIPLRAIHQVRLLTEHVRSRLPAVKAPALVFMSREDPSLKFKGAQVVLDEIGSSDKTLITLTESGHNPLIDREHESVFEQTAAFFQRLTSA
jgi:carboxylesterase